MGKGGGGGSEVGILGAGGRTVGGRVKDLFWRRWWWLGGKKERVGEMEKKRLQ